MKVPTCKECNWQFDPGSVDMGVGAPGFCPNCDGESWIEVEEGKAGALIKCCDLESCQVEDDSETHLCRSCGEHTCEIVCMICDETIFESSCCA